MILSMKKTFPFEQYCCSSTRTLKVKVFTYSNLQKDANTSTEPHVNNKTISNLKHYTLVLFHYTLVEIEYPDYRFHVCYRAYTSSKHTCIGTVT
jgi:hypothetical protein